MVVIFNKVGHDLFIDFVKAYCILVVVFCHGFLYLKEVGYSIWGVQIPLFLLIQVFHCYKRPPKPVNWKSIIKRILLPFLVIEFFILCIQFFTGNSGYRSLFFNILCRGGYGPGSYYPWIFIQMAILIPIMRSICDRLGKCKSLCFFLVISECIEIICSLISLPDNVYRLLCLRYIMLIWFGWIWAKEGIKLNVIIIVVSVLSLCTNVYLEYYNKSCEPWLYETGWATHRWPCYFWASFLFVGILYKAYKIAIKSNKIKKAIKELAAASYEIFLVQMAYYSLVRPNYLFFIKQTDVKMGLCLILAFIISIAGGIIMRKIEKKYIQ